MDFDPDNTTSTPLDKRWDSNANPMQMYIEGTKQHVGTLRGNRLRNKILECLSFVDSCEIEDVVYGDVRAIYLALCDFEQKLHLRDVGIGFKK